MRRFKKVKMQIEAVEFLRLLKEDLTYEELEEVTGLSTVDLNRYVKGRVLPDLERAEKILDFVGQDYLVDEVKKRIETDPDGYINHSNVIFSTRILKRIPPLVSNVFESTPDKVITAAVDGITVAAHIANYFDVDCVYAKKEKETGVKEFLETSSVLDSGYTVTYYLPKSSLSENEEVLMVDDLIRTGHTQLMLDNLVEKAGSKLYGVFALFSFGESAQDLEEKLSCTVKTLINFE